MNTCNTLSIYGNLNENKKEIANVYEGIFNTLYLIPVLEVP